MRSNGLKQKLIYRRDGARRRSFKVTHFGPSRKLVYDFLLANNTYILSRTVSKLLRIIG